MCVSVAKLESFFINIICGATRRDGGGRCIDTMRGGTARVCAAVGGRKYRLRAASVRFLIDVHKHALSIYARARTKVGGWSRSQI